jgi:hypothetical protein
MECYEQGLQFLFYTYFYLICYLNLSTTVLGQSEPVILIMSQGTMSSSAPEAELYHLDSRKQSKTSCRNNTVTAQEQLTQEIPLYQQKNARLLMPLYISFY